MNTFQSRQVQAPAFPGSPTRGFRAVGWEIGERVL